MASRTVRVHGLRELNRAFARYGAEEKKALQASLKAAGEPVRTRAEDLAAANITNIGPDWSQMRVGATTKVVYVAPKRRRNPNLRRPNLAPLLMDSALSPALEETEPEVVALVGGVLDMLGERWGAGA